jgi:GTPase SAR1 family protein
MVAVSYDVLRQKVIFMGEAGVGKTSLINAFQRQNDRDSTRRVWEATSTSFSPEYVPTVGVDIRQANGTRTRNIRGCENEVQVLSSFLDFGGDPRYLKVRSEFYSDFHGGVLVFDVSSRASFEQLQFWLTEATKCGASKPFKCVVCGTKVDLLESRVVTESTARAWSSSKGFEYFDVSGRTGQNVATSIESLLSVIDGERKVTSFQMPDNKYTAPNIGSRPATAGPTGSRASANSESDGKKATGSRYSVDPNELSIQELKLQLTRLGVNFSDCLEKRDFVNKLTATVRERQEIKRTSEKAAEEDKQKEKSKNDIKANILREVQEWTRSKEIWHMLNDVRGIGPSDPDFLTASSSLADVSRGYKKACLKIHPDKVDSSSFAAHLRATEMFKTVSNAFEEFKSRTNSKIADLPAAKRGRG